MNVCSSSIHIHQKLEVIQLSFNKWMDKQIVVLEYNKTLLNNTKEQTVDAQNRAGESQMHSIEWKKSDSKDDILYDSTRMIIVW